MRSIFLFHRDLRLEDNSALIRALKESEEVLPLFIIDPRQVEDNEYKSLYAIGFMIDSLIDLDNELKKHNSKLHVLKGIAEEILPKIAYELNIERVYFNEDYTPFSIKRDSSIKERFKGEVITEEDYLLVKKNFFINKGKPYSVFTHFYKDALNLDIRKPIQNRYNNYIKADLPGIEILRDIKYERPALKGGRNEALKLLERARSIDYRLRNIPAANATTMLSAYIKFGCISIREAFHNLNDSIKRQLFWRDFYTLLAYYNPHVFGHAYKREYENIRWNYDEKLFEAWKNGLTGYPIIDAGMRELNQTGYMHNRVRMIAASFLVKVLHIDWRLGERYFATKLVDYDPSVNNGNWQWVASTGADYMFRLFNPWIQQKKFDPNADYIKRWVPELKDLEPDVIHNIYNYNIDNYPKPIADYYKEIKTAKQLYGIYNRSY
ncbi:MAG: deoxyribodipyrimidine photo-lyase [Candidatus Micrarchaeota archaeon]|nr:MAG: deoxyribodipyrimidine photo-lyase [Candidatus Micrarchaeota archaeon]